MLFASLNQRERGSGQLCFCRPEGRAADTDTNAKNFYDLPREFRKRREGQEETPRDRERRERQEQWEREREDEDPFEQRRRWEAQAKLKQRQ